MAPHCIEHLLKDHREGERIVSELESLLNQRQEGCWTAARSASFARVAHFVDEVVMAHVRKEEDVLFPALGAFLPSDTGPLAVLRGEHQELAETFKRFLEAGGRLSAGSSDAAVCEEFERTGRAMIQGFRDHVYKEDRILFPMVARFLSPEGDARLLEQMEAKTPAPKAS